MTAKIDDLVAAYVKLRDKKKDIVAGHKAQLAPYNDGLQKLEGFLMKRMADAGVESAKTTSGTAYTSTRAQAVVEDWDKCFAFVQEKGLAHILTRSVSKTAVEEYIEDTGEPVPGVRINRVITLGVRKA